MEHECQYVEGLYYSDGRKMMINLPPGAQIPVNFLTDPAIKNRKITFPPKAAPEKEKENAPARNDAHEKGETAADDQADADKHADISSPSTYEDSAILHYSAVPDFPILNYPAGQESAVLNYYAVQDSSEPVADSTPPAVDDLIDECPEFLLLAEKLVDADFPHETIVMNGHHYYKLPSDFPRPSKELRNRLHTAKRRNNCADCNPLIPTHLWKHCPYAPHPARTNFVYPDHHSPMVVTPPTWNASVGTPLVSPSTTLQIFPLGLSTPTLCSYVGRTSWINGAPDTYMYHPTRIEWSC